MPEQRLKILFVGRDGSARQRMMDILRLAGYAVDGTRPGPRMLSHIRSRKFAMLVADLEDEDVLEPITRDGVNFLSGMEDASMVLSVRSTTGRGKPGRSKRVRPRGGVEKPPMTLRALRQSTGRTQGEVARAIEMTQPQLSRVEARRDHLMSTLRKYVHALGGEVEVVAVVDGSRIPLHDV